MHIPNRLSSVTVLLSQWRSLADDIRAGQIKSVGIGYPATFLITQVVIVTLLTTSRDGHLPLVAGGAAGLVIVSGVTLRGWLRNRRNAWCIDDPPRAHRRLVIQAICTALAWYVMLAAVGVDNRGGQRELIDCVMLGVLCAGAARYAAVPAASLAFIVASFVSIVVYASLIGLPFAVTGLLCLFTLLLTRSTLEQAQLFLDHRRAGEELLARTIAGEQLRAASAVAQAEMKADADRLALAARDRATQVTRTLSAQRDIDLGALSRAFEISVGSLVAELSAQTKRGFGAAESLGALIARSAASVSRLSPRVREMSEGHDRVAQGAVALRAMLERVTHHVERQTRNTAAAQANLIVNERAADLLDQRADKVGRIVTLISDLAVRTNLLALNASIEAARAGAAARGFDAVAKEVKHLAQQSRSAAQEIAGEIAGMQSAIRAVTDSIASVRESFAVIPAIIAALDEAMAAQHQLVETVTTRSQASLSLHATLDQETSAATDDAVRADALSADLLSTIAGIATHAATVLESTRSFHSEIETAMRRPIAA